MNATLIHPGDCEYPAGVQKAFGERPLPAITAIGDRELFRCRPLALFCSIKYPGDVILRTFDLMRIVVAKQLLDKGKDAGATNIRRRFDNRDPMILITGQLTSPAGGLPMVGDKL
jgi:hypothetical protein